MFLTAALVIFIPMGLVEVVDDRIQEPLHEVDDQISEGRIVAVLGVALSHSAVVLLGDVLYTGLAARAVIGVRVGAKESPWAVARTIPYLRLAGADLLLALATGIGLFLFVIPGLVVLGWFALIAPAIEVEERGIASGFRRSRELVRGNLLRMLLLIVPLLILNDLIVSAIQSKDVIGIESGFAVDWAAAVLADLLTVPIYALAVVVAFFQLRDGPHPA